PLRALGSKVGGGSAQRQGDAPAGSDGKRLASGRAPVLSCAPRNEGTEAEAAEMIRVTILDDFQQATLRLADWQSLHPRAQIEALGAHIADEAELAHRLHASEAVVAMRERTPFPASLFARLPNLKLLVTTGARNPVIDLAAAAAPGVTVC